MRGSTQKHQNEHGFTLVELMIATVAFSVILLIAATSLIQIGRMYYQGYNAARTQETARNIIDSISRPLQFAGHKFTAGAPINNFKGNAGLTLEVFCVDNQRFTYFKNVQVSDNVTSGTFTGSPIYQARHALWQDTIANPNTDCKPVNLLISDPSDTSNPDALNVGNSKGKELLTQNMRLGKAFALSPQTAESFSIKVPIIYGDHDLLNNPDDPTQCKGSVVGSQWCAVSDLSTTIVKRVQ